MADPKTSVEFRTLAIGQRFWCYLHPENEKLRWCECVKNANNFATEIGGKTFRLSGEFEVSLQREQPQLPNPETLPDVTYIPVAPDDHAELIRKAAAYNELKAVIDRLDCEI